MKYLKLPEGKTIWSSLLPLSIAAYLLFSMISISISQIFITLSLILWIVMLIREKQKFTFPSLFWPLLAYIMLSIISSFISVDPNISLKDSKELLLFLIIPIAYIGFSEEKMLKKTNLAILASAYASFLYSLYQLFFKISWPKKRITGFMNNAMTQGGLLLLFCCLALSLYLFSKDKHKYLWGTGFLISFISLILTQTRSAWIGLIIASSLILFIYKPKLIIVVPIAIAIIYFISPQTIKKRAISSFGLKGYNKLRIEYLKAGILIIGDYPLFGTGPDTVDIVFQDPKYGLSEEAKKNVHLHNNIIQTAAERGIPTLIAWLAFIAIAFLSLFKLLKNKDPTLRSLTVAALGAIVGLFIAGLFEYNFADSEITALFLYIITIPFTLARIKDKESSVEAK